MREPASNQIQNRGPIPPILPELLLIIRITLIIRIQIRKHQPKANHGQNRPEQPQPHNLPEHHQHPEHRRAHLRVPENGRIQFVKFPFSVPRFEDPLFVAFFVNKAPPSEADEESAADVFYGPEVADGAARNYDETAHGVEEHAEEKEAGDGGDFEDAVEDADPGVRGLC